MAEGGAALLPFLGWSSKLGAATLCQSWTIREVEDNDGELLARHGRRFRIGIIEYGRFFLVTM
jgi:hypothetical protein